jgi:hypothetical protein
MFPPSGNEWEDEQSFLSSEVGLEMDHHRLSNLPSIKPYSGKIRKRLLFEIIVLLQSRTPIVCHEERLSFTALHSLDCIIYATVEGIFGNERGGASASYCVFKWYKVNSVHYVAPAR